MKARPGHCQELVVTPSGDLTAYSERYGEHYSSRHGPVAQSKVVFLEGSATHLHPAPRILEIGFGLGLNFRTTLRDVSGRAASLHYCAYEAFPVSSALLRQVSAGEAHPLWARLLEHWDEAARRGRLEVALQGVTLTVYFADVSAAALPLSWASAIYLDGFSPTKNPEVWTPEFLATLARALSPGGVLATYSAAGAVRRGLAAAGLKVEKRRGLAGKREFAVAAKP